MESGSSSMPASTWKLATGIQLNRCLSISRLSSPLTEKNSASA